MLTRKHPHRRRRARTLRTLWTTPLLSLSVCRAIRSHFLSPLQSFFLCFLFLFSSPERMIETRIFLKVATARQTHGMLTGTEGHTRRLRYADFRLLRNRWTRRRRFRARAECYRESLRGPQESARARFSANSQRLCKFPETRRPLTLHSPWLGESVTTGNCYRARKRYKDKGA